MKSAVLELSGRIDAFFEEGRKLWWSPDWGLRRRTLRACGVEIDLLLAPWRAVRRPGGGDTPPAGSDVGARVVREETLWEEEVASLTPNRYPVWEDHLLLWEKAPLREPDQPFLEFLLRLCRGRKDLFCFVNSIGAAATVSRSHAQIARVKEPPPIGGVPVRVRSLDGLEVAFPPEGGPWPGFFVRFTGDPEKTARALERLVRLRLCPSFNLAFHRDRAWIFFRKKETCSFGYPLPLGALELSGTFLFEEETSFQAMTPEGIHASLREVSFPPGPAQEEAVAAALA